MPSEKKRLNHSSFSISCNAPGQPEHDTNVDDAGCSDTERSSGRSGQSADTTENGGHRVAACGHPPGGRPTDECRREYHTHTHQPTFRTSSSTLLFFAISRDVLQQITLSTLQGLQSSGQPGQAILLKTENGQFQLLRVGPSPGGQPNMTSASANQTIRLQTVPAVSRFTGPPLAIRKSIVTQQQAKSKQANVNPKFE